MEIALFGGSFNPPHVGHALACNYVLHTGMAQSVLILPVYKHPLGKALLPFHHRVNMCRLLFPGDIRVQVHEWEKENKSGLTIDLLEKFLLFWPPNVKFKWLIGSDCMIEKNKWEGFDRVEKLVDLIPIVRFQTYDGEISSTNIRREIAKGAAPTGVIPEVLKYIKNNKLDSFFTESGGVK